MEFVYFLGRFHVLALHIPIGVLMAVALLEILVRFVPRFAPLRAASPFLWGVAAVSAIGAVILGYMHYAEGGFEGPSVSSHRFWGTSVAVVTTIAWGVSLIKEELFHKAAAWVGLVLVAMVSITGHFGGNITHGSTYLVEYAPGFIRALIGEGERRARVTDLAVADPYLDIIKPLTDLRCESCHNDDKKSGELSMVSYESLMSGGEFLPPIVVGDSAASPLVQRITLPQDDEDFMPAEGKTPLTERQTQIFIWWIDAGTPHDTTVGALGVSPEVEAMLKAELGIE